MAENKPWNLESFVDALVVELDKTRETLALKSINKSVSYTVKDMSMDLQIFPKYDGDQVTFLTAQPGQEGASKVTLQLASITDQQVRSTTKRINEKDDININKLDVDDETKKSLRKIGVTTIKDLEAIDSKNVDIESRAPGKINYSNLANMIRKAKRNSTPPKIKKVTMSSGFDEQSLVVDGDHLAINNLFKPIAIINNHLVTLDKHNSNQISVSFPKEVLQQGRNEMVLTLEPYSVCKFSFNYTH